MTTIVPPEYQVNRYASITELALRKILKSMDVAEEDYRILPRRLKELSNYFLRDLYRINEQQRGTISSTRFAGYWAFWIRKIKPIAYLYDKTATEYETDTESSEITDINERIAIQLGLKFLAHEGKGVSGQLHDFVRSQCDRTDCTGKECVNNYATDLFGFHDSLHQEYLVQSMKHRTFGPHHITIIFEHLLHAACRASQETSTCPK